MLSTTKAVSAASVLLLFLFLQEAAGLARVSILFVKYNNPGGKGNNGQCCDGRWKICQRNGCDHRFTICLGLASSERNIKNCKYGRLQSKKIPNQNDITFGSSFGGLTNPVYFTVNEPLPKSMDLKVDVWDSDSTTKDDFVDFLKTSIKTWGRTANTAKPTKYTLQARTRLAVQVTVNCASYWYNDRCSLYCKPRNDTGGHYKCLPTGQKRCLSGWTGRGCNWKISKPTTSKPITTATSKPLAQDCDDLAVNHGYKYKDGLYTIRVKGLPTAFQVYCDMSSRGRTLIQQRVDGSVNFNRTWNSYKFGFGTPGVNTNYWMGLERLHRLTQQRKYKLDITMQLYNHAFRFAYYTTFRVEGEYSGFKLRIGGYSGNAGDAFSSHNGAKFSTYDRDNDEISSKYFDCAKRYGSGWWFKACFYANLNGVYKKSTNGWPKCKSTKYGPSICIKWGALPSSIQDYSLRRVAMYLSV